MNLLFLLTTIIDFNRIYSVLYKRGERMKEHYGFYLKRIHLEIDQRMNEKLKDLNLTKSQLDILLYLLRHQDENISQRDIEKKFSISNPTVTGILNRLEAKGYIERHISKEDARSKLVRITPSVLLLDGELRANLDMIESLIVKGLSDRQKDEFLNCLKVVLRNLEDDRDLGKE